MAKTTGIKLIANNKKAFHDYFIEDTYEAGISLAGTEVKSLRMGKCSIKESFIRVERGEVYIYGMHISPYEMLEDLRLTNEYKAIKLFNYKSDNFSESIEQCRDSFIVVDNADNLINDEIRRFINFEPSNQYMLFLRNCDGLNVSDKSFKVLKFGNNRITLEEEL